MADFHIRPAAPGDLEDVTRIYNHYVVQSAITFDLAPFSVEERRPWFERFAPGSRYQLFVAERGGSVVGYAGTLPFRAKAAYETSVETTIYLDADCHGGGLGTRLYRTLFDALQGVDVHRVLAGITLPNDASLALHRRFGFQQVGVMREVGRKHDRYWDVAWLDRPL